VLYFAPPIRQYGNMFIFPDNGNPQQFYYMPNFPHLAKTDTGAPAIQLLIYKKDLANLPPGEETEVGFLSLDVDLSFTDDEVQKATARLRSDLNLPTDPTLAPIFFRSGTVRFLLLDTATPTPGHENDPVKPTDFVENLQGAASPSLYGDNRAIFQARVSKKGAEAILGSLGGTAPIGVVYQLTMAGLQPAYHIRVKADWHKVYKHFSEMSGYESAFTDDETQKAIDDLVDNKTITVVDVIEGVGDEADQKDHDSVMTDIRHFLMETFFTQTLNKETPAGEGTVDQVGSVLDDICSAPFSIFGKSVHKLKTMTDDELRTLDIDWSVSKAATRDIYPQAHLSTMFAGAQITRDQLVRIVEGGQDAAFKTISLIVGANCAWDQEKVAAISVEVDYGDGSTGAVPTWSFQLTKDAPTVTKQAWFQPSVPQHVTYRYEVVFMPPPVGYAGPALSMKSGDRISDGLAPLYITPLSLYRRVECTVSAVPGMPFDKVPAISVAIRFTDEDGSFTHSVDAVLMQSNPSFATVFRARAASLSNPEVQYTYTLATGQVDVRDWVATAGDATTGNVFVVPSPYPSALTVVALAPDPNKFNAAVLELQYLDVGGNVLADTMMTFGGDKDARVQTWNLPIADASRRRYRYRVTLTYKNASVGSPDFIASDWIDTDRPQLPLGESLLRQLDVQLSLASRDRTVDHVLVHLQYDDAANALHVATDGTLVDPTDVARLSLALKDLTQTSYTYTVTWTTMEGFTRSVGPITSTKRYLQIPGTPPRDG
jgi:hypothetical protein